MGKSHKQPTLKSHKQPTLKSHKQPTLKSLGLVEGTKLSPTYDNQKDDYKIVEEVPIGFGFVRGQWAQVFPIYRATIFSKGKFGRRVITSYERGEPLMPYTLQDAESSLARQYHFLAFTADNAVRAVESHAEVAKALHAMHKADAAAVKRARGARKRKR